jgi:MFS family permease
MNPAAPSTTGPWWRSLDRYHWFVFAMASLAWMFDCLDQQLFILARPAAMKALLPPGMDANEYGGYATAIFVAGWATGGLFFGALGDRVGRARTLTLTVLLYSVFTGLSALSTGWIDFAAYRFITGLGVGGVFGLAVALIADALPDRARTGALGSLLALSGVGNVTAGLISMGVGQLVATNRLSADWSWKLMFLFGALPAFLCVFLQMRLKEPEKWVKARAEGRRTGVAFGSYASLFGEARWRRPALFGMVLCVAGVIGLWDGPAPELVGPTSSPPQPDLPRTDRRRAGIWIGINSIVFNLGAFVACCHDPSGADPRGARLRIAFLPRSPRRSLLQLFNGKEDIWMSAAFAGAPANLRSFAEGSPSTCPSLFPDPLAAPGTSFCYNVGWFLAASGLFHLGRLCGSRLLKAWRATSLRPRSRALHRRHLHERDSSRHRRLIFRLSEPRADPCQRDEPPRA